MTSFNPSFIRTLSDTRSMIDFESDLNSINTINTKIKELDSINNNTLMQHRSRLTQLTNQLETVKTTIEQLKSSPKVQATKTSLITLENEIFQIANNLTQLAMDISSLKFKHKENINKLDELENNLQELKESNYIDNTMGIGRSSGGDSASISEKSKIIKLKLYESLGLKLNFDKGEVLILNKQANKTNVVKIDDSYSEYFISNLVWDNL
ncbi:hypothetical protein CANARDRAFT_27741 [[Candida] arabinofermentans NRRL YB-2248]|uniref:Kinetochore protein Spc24 n=1 Tax=[Candida] arabinofermentans NRRL YB-2248 TaxID=983967 RepID=A0A1E4T455_9ASCO|nr:hypothetical protein CANARDRAFT_27741 [[Candida] arabinofermentans NRRL YB-2248]